jgi:hypothetical protein
MVLISRLTFTNCSFTSPYNRPFGESAVKCPTSRILVQMKPMCPDIGANLSLFPLGLNFPKLDCVAGRE